MRGARNPVRRERRRWGGGGACRRRTADALGPAGAALCCAQVRQGERTLRPGRRPSPAVDLPRARPAGAGRGRDGGVAAHLRSSGPARLGAQAHHRRPTHDHQHVGAAGCSAQAPQDDRPAGRLFELPRYGRVGPLPEGLVSRARRRRFWLGAGGVAVGHRRSPAMPLSRSAGS